MLCRNKKTFANKLNKRNEIFACDNSINLKGQMSSYG